MSDCIPTGLLGLLGVRYEHRFEARHERPPLTASQIRATGAALAMNVDQVTLEDAQGDLYVGDICTRCGLFLPRPNKEPQG